MNRVRHSWIRLRGSGRTHSRQTARAPLIRHGERASGVSTRRIRDTPRDPSEVNLFRAGIYERLMDKDKVDLVIGGLRHQYSVAGHAVDRQRFFQ